MNDKDHLAGQLTMINPDHWLTCVLCFLSLPAAQRLIMLMRIIMMMMIKNGDEEYTHTWENEPCPVRTLIFFKSPPSLFTLARLIHWWAERISTKNLSLSTSTDRKISKNQPYPESLSLSWIILNLLRPFPVNQVIVDLNLEWPAINDSF